MPIFTKETRTRKKTIPCSIILRFWSNKENAKIKAKRSAHIEKQDCFRGLLFCILLLYGYKLPRDDGLLPFMMHYITCTAHYSGTIIHLQMFVNTFCYNKYGKDDLPCIKRID